MKNLVIIGAVVLVLVLLMRNKAMAAANVPGGKLQPGIDTPPATNQATVDLAIPSSGSGNGTVIMVNGNNDNSLLDGPYDPVLSGSYSL